MKFKLKDGQMVALDAQSAHLVNTGVIDADVAFFFQRQLEHIKARSYDVVYADLNARKVIPVSNEAGAGVQTITYRQYDQVGSAKIINSYADDLPRADVSGQEFTIPVRSVGVSYGYNIDELQASQMTGASLDQRRANAAVRANEETVNTIGFFGDTASGLPGFFSNPNIPTGSVVNPGSGTEWVNKTPDEILFDVNDLFADIFETTKMKERGNTLLLPPNQYSYIASTPRSANSDTTIMQYLVNNCPYLSSAEDIIPLNECNAADNPLYANDIMVAYNRSPDKLEFEIPVELEWQPMQFRGLEIIVPGRSRVGGVNVYYPLSAAIAEGI